MKKDSRVYLLDILDSIERIEKYTDSLSFTDFEKNLLVQDAVVWNFSIIGEAGRRLEDNDFQNSEIPLRQIISMRNRLVHEYDQINVQTLWLGIKQDIPQLKLKKVILQIISEL